MVTDDERRRVARNIRENYIRTGMGYRAGSAYNIALAVGVVPDILVGDTVLWNRLADLIEPSDASQSCRDTVACDREALLALMKWLDARAADLLKTNSIDHSRRRVSARKEHAMDLMAACSCIREALSAGAAREIGDEIVEAIGEVDES